MLDIMVAQTYRFDLKKKKLILLEFYSTEVIVRSTLKFDKNMKINWLKISNKSNNFYRFEELPECIFELSNLEILTANDNKMSSINANALCKLKSLVNLDLSNNNIGYVPPELGNMKSLK